MNGDQAKPLYDMFLEKLEKSYGKPDKVFPGAFGQHMNIEMVNDGPVTLVIDSVKDPKALAKWEKEQAKIQKQKEKQQQKKEQEESKSPAKEEEKKSE